MVIVIRMSLLGGKCSWHCCPELKVEKNHQPSLPYSLKQEERMGPELIIKGGRYCFPKRQTASLLESALTLGDSFAESLTL